MSVLEDSDVADLGRLAQDAAEMPLIELDAQTWPKPDTVMALDLADGTRLRAARWHSPSEPSNGTVLIATGRGEFIEKYLETVADLQRRRFAVVVFDWRGQGLSSRALRNKHKGHVDDFRQFEADLDAVVRKVLLPFCPRPYYLLAHSMGGTVAIHCAHRGEHLFRRMVLSAPMVEIARLPFPQLLAPSLAWLARAGLTSAFVPQGHRTAVFSRGFEHNVLTSDIARYNNMLALSLKEPGLTIGAPTVGWLHAAFQAMAPFEDIEFARRITTPMLVVVPGGDQVIDVAAMERFASRLKAGTLVGIPHAQHEVLMERDLYRDQFWAAFDEFIPGTRP